MGTYSHLIVVNLYKEFNDFLISIPECKSTCLKQMQILHNNGYQDEKERISKKCVVYSNLVKSMVTLLTNMPSYVPNHGVKDIDALQERLDVFLEAEFDCKDFPPQVASIVKTLWANPSIKKTYLQRNNFQLIDSAEYFFDNLDRIVAEDYIPTIDDVVRTRIPTTGVVQVNFRLKNIDFKIYDVGGQRSERKKWIHCFDNVHGLLFIAAVSEYNQVLREDSKTNRLHEAMELFDNVSNSFYFVATSIIIFLNKKDIFEEKIKTYPIKESFPSYDGANDYSSSIKYIGKRFRKQYRGNRQVYMHLTCATDTNQVKHILNSVIDVGFLKVFI
uniref:Guanine nucleotide-binding protein G(Q) subunit alpha n=1 Tax=Rhabditophanes sp. KR3021 TaxID=114890 RepID=A0AC35U3M4_9BILA